MARINRRCLRLFFLTAPILAGGALVTGAEAPVPACPAIPASSIPRDWKRVTLRNGFSVALPPSCVAQEQPRTMHGGDRWQCGTIGVEVVWGMWGASSFGKTESQCRRTVSGIATLESVRREGDNEQQIVWYRTGSVHEPIVSAWSAKAPDRPTIQTITRSGALLRAGQ
jgi:hypothetical protein